MTQTIRKWSSMGAETFSIKSTQAFDNAGRTAGAIVCASSRCFPQNVTLLSDRRSIWFARRVNRISSLVNRWMLDLLHIAEGLDFRAHQRARGSGTASDLPSDRLLVQDSKASECLCDVPQAKTLEGLRHLSSGFRLMSMLTRNTFHS